jgi:uncharacterized protein YndB with AHSA1/START domain
MRHPTAVLEQDLHRMPSSGRKPASTLGATGRGNPRAVVDLSAGTVTASGNMACPPERLYRMLVTAETERWWGSPETYAMREWNAELRTGGSWRVLVCFLDGRRLPASGRFLEFDPPEKIVQTRRYELDHPTLGRRETRVSYLIQPREGGARLTVFHEGFHDLEEAAVEHAVGWERVLGWLEPYARAVNDEQRRWQ